jgi:hypothetical protein
MGQKKTKARRGGAGRNQGRKTEDGTRGLKRLNVTLDVESVESVRRLGDGNLSLGIRKAVRTARRVPRRVDMKAGSK